MKFKYVVCVCERERERERIIQPDGQSAMQVKAQVQTVGHRDAQYWCCSEAETRSQVQPKPFPNSMIQIIIKYSF